MFNGLEIQFIGNLTRDPGLRYLPSGNAVCNLSLAVNSVSTGADGERQERTDYVRATLWGKSAENANQYLVKGQEVICRGRLCVIRPMAIGDSGACRSPIPVDADQVGGRDHSSGRRRWII